MKFKHNVYFIGFAAQKYSGKDTARRFFEKKIEKDFPGRSVQCRLAKGLKDFCKKYLGLTQNQVEGNEKESLSPLGTWDNVCVNWAMADSGPMTNRHVMQYVGQVMTDCFTHIWLRDAVRTAKWQYNRFGKRIFIVPDIRRKDEIGGFQEMARSEPTIHFCVVKINRGQSSTDDPHSSELELLDMPDETFDFIVDNSSGLEDFYNNLNTIYLEWKEQIELI